MGKIRIGSLNCRGLASDLVKRRDIFHRCRSKYDITILTDTHSDANSETVWRNEWGGDIKFASFSSNRRGIAILFKNSFEYSVEGEYKDPGGNFLLLNMIIQNVKLTLCGIYGPNDDTPTFFSNLQNKIEAIGNDTIIIAGDWNVALEYAVDTVNYRNRNNTRSNIEIHNMMQNLDLIDVWREFNPNDRKYTWFGPNGKKSRLDYFLVSSVLQNNIPTAGMDFAYKSDHSPVSIELEFMKQQRGRGTWKFNNSLLGDLEYVNLIKNTITEVLEQYRIDENEHLENVKFNISDKLFWETLKLAIRGKTISYSSFKKREREKEEDNLENELNKLYNKYQSECNAQLLQDISETEGKLKILREKKIKGIVTRAKVRWKVEGEKSTKYFCNLEKRQYNEKMIPKLINNNGEEIKDLHEILAEQSSFYSHLYHTKGTLFNDIHEELFFNDNNPFINKLTDEQRESMNGSLKAEECLKIIKNMSNGKSPGLDGFTVEFYKFFWSDLKVFLLRSINESFRDQEMSISQRQGLIKCIPKEGKSKLYLKNWRPITLLNVDYKIASSCIANRIKQTLVDIISPSQAGFVKGRYIGECTRVVSDVIEKLEKNNQSGILLMLDFEKAFDSIEWSFIEKSLLFFGFNDYIINCFKTLYTNISASVENNGHLSTFFQVSRGVRQGDPLSPYLFIICIELLSAAIKYDPDVKGIILNNSEYLISQYADDSTLMLDDDIRSLNKCLYLIDTYGECSGLKTNFDKSQAVWIGVKRGCGEEIETEHALSWNHQGKFKLLGVRYDLSKSDIYEDNFIEKLKSVKSLLSDWSFRNLSIIGRVTVIKTLVFPIIVQILTVVPSPHVKILKQFQTLFFHFIWNSRIEKLKRNLLIGDFKEGGLKVPDIFSYSKSLKLTWIKRCLDPNNHADWKKLLIDDIEIFGGNNIWSLTKDGLAEIIERYSFGKFWKEIIGIWGNLYEPSSAAPENVLSQPLWFNKDIKVDRKTIFFKDLCNEGIFYVKDVVDEQGNIMSFNTFIKKYRIKINFINFNSIISAIPRGWKRIIKHYGRNIENVVHDNLRQLKNMEKPSRYFYHKLLSRVLICPQQSHERWHSILGISLNQDDWKTIHALPFYETNDSKLQSLQYRITHRIFFTNSMLFKRKLLEHQECSFCSGAPETIYHLFWDCTHSQSLWTSFVNLVLLKYNVVLEKKPTTFLFGKVDNVPLRGVNICILLIKKYISLMRQKSKIPNWESCKLFIQNYRNLDLYSTYMLTQNAANKTRQKWESIKLILE